MRKIIIKSSISSKKHRSNKDIITQKLISLFFIFSTAEATYGQIIVTTPYEFAYGISGGTTFSSVTFNPRVTQKSLQGLTFGATGRMNMGNTVGMQLEINYVQEGWDEEYEEYSDLYYSRRLNYLQIPFNTRVQFGSNKLKGFLSAGPQIGYLLGGSIHENLGETSPGKVNEQHNMPITNRFEWGINGGAGLEIRSIAGLFILEGRYFYSFGDIYSTQRKDFFSKASSQSIMVKLSYLITVK